MEKIWTLMKMMIKLTSQSRVMSPGKFFYIKYFYVFRLIVVFERTFFVPTEKSSLATTTVASEEEENDENFNNYKKE
jgi:hypothetical protein